VQKHAGPWVAKMSGEKRATLQDRVPQARLYKVWNVPGFCDAEANLLGMAASVLASGKNSRLYERLVYRDQIATAVDAGMGPFEIASQFVIDAMAKPGGDIAKVEQAIDEELARFLKDGPTRSSAFSAINRSISELAGGPTSGRAAKPVTPIASAKRRYVSTDATMMRASTLTRSIPTSETRT
jgi:zinc protease